MSALIFDYTDSGGKTRLWSLVNIHETEYHFSGIATDIGAYRTFKKTRVNRYLDGSEAMLNAPFAVQPTVEKPPAGLDILFTGFAAARRKELENLTKQVDGLKLVKTPTEHLRFICCGYNAGPSKVRTAIERGAWVLTEDDFLRLIDTGELPL